MKAKRKPRSFKPWPPAGLELPSFWCRSAIKAKCAAIIGSHGKMKSGKYILSGVPTDNDLTILIYQHQLIRSLMTHIMARTFNRHDGDELVPAVPALLNVPSRRAGLRRFGYLGCLCKDGANKLSLIEPSTANGKSRITRRNGVGCSWQCTLPLPQPFPWLLCIGRLHPGSSIFPQIPKWA